MNALIKINDAAVGIAVKTKPFFVKLDGVVSRASKFCMSMPFIAYILLCFTCYFLSMLFDTDNAQSIFSLITSDKNNGLESVGRFMIEPFVSIASLKFNLTVILLAICNLPVIHFLLNFAFSLLRKTDLWQTSK